MLFSAPKNAEWPGQLSPSESRKKSVYNVLCLVCTERDPAYQIPAGLTPSGSSDRCVMSFRVGVSQG